MRRVVVVAAFILGVAAWPVGAQIAGTTLKANVVSSSPAYTAGTIKAVTQNTDGELNVSCN